MVEISVGDFWFWWRGVFWVSFLGRRVVLWGKRSLF